MNLLAFAKQLVTSSRLSSCRFLWVGEFRPDFWSARLVIPFSILLTPLWVCRDRRVGHGALHTPEIPHVQFYGILFVLQHEPTMISL